MPTPAQLVRLQTALSWAESALASENANPDDVERKLRKTVEKEAPAVARMVDIALGSRSAALGTWIQVMLAVVALIIGGQQQSLSAEDVAKVVEKVLENHQPPAQP